MRVCSEKENYNMSDLLTENLDKFKHELMSICIVWYQVTIFLGAYYWGEDYRSHPCWTRSLGVSGSGGVKASCSVCVPLKSTYVNLYQCEVRMLVTSTSRYIRYTVIRCYKSSISYY